MSEQKKREQLFGIKPDREVPMSWNARAIYQDDGRCGFQLDLVANRQQIVGGTEKERELFGIWVDYKGLPALRKLAKQHLLLPSEDREASDLVDGYVITANPKRSGGHIYLGIWPGLVRTAHFRLAEEVARAWRERGGKLPEADENINAACRSVIVATQREYGCCHLGIINRFQYHGDAGQTPWMWPWTGDGSAVKNFSVDFVAPCEDAELVELLEERFAEQLKSAEPEAVPTDKILKRLEMLGGVHLLWT